MPNRLPEHLPPEFLRRADFIEACTARDIGTMFAIMRKWLGFTNSHLARRCEMGVSQVAAYINGRRRSTSVAIFERTADGLHIPGAMLGLERRPWEERSVRASTDTLADHPGGVAASVKQDADVAIPPEADCVKRRDFLRDICATAAIAALPPLDEDVALPSPEAQMAIAGHEAMADHLWQVFMLARNKSSVWTIAREQLSVSSDALLQIGGPEDRRKLCVVLSSLYQLTGEISYDENRHGDAAQYYSLAASAAKEAKSYDLWACALTRHTYVGIARDLDKQFVPILEAAMRIAQLGDHSLSTRQWVAAVQAEVFSRLGDLKSCEKALHRAEEIESSADPGIHGGWLRFDSSRLPEQRGACYARLGRGDLAEVALHDALTKTASPRRRGSILVNLAKISIECGDVRQAVDYGSSAIGLLEKTSSGYIASRLKEIAEPFEAVRYDPEADALIRHIQSL